MFNQEQQVTGVIHTLTRQRCLPIGTKCGRGPLETSTAIGLRPQNDGLLRRACSVDAARHCVTLHADRQSCQNHALFIFLPKILCLIGLLAREWYSHITGHDRSFRSRRRIGHATARHRIGRLLIGAVSEITCITCITKPNSGRVAWTT